MSYRKYLMTGDEPPSELYKAVELGTNLAEVGTDCISRQAAIDRATKEHDFFRGAVTVSDKARRDELLNVICWLGELPPIQPERIKARWLPIGIADAVGGESAMWGDKIAYHVCEKCWKQALERDGEEVLSDFCPNCGADMRGDQDG